MVISQFLMQLAFRAVYFQREQMLRLLRRYLKDALLGSFHLEYPLRPMTHSHV